MKLEYLTVRIRDAEKIKKALDVLPNDTLNEGKDLGGIEGSVYLLGPEESSIFQFTLNRGLISIKQPQGCTFFATNFRDSRTRFVYKGIEYIFIDDNKSER